MKTFLRTFAIFGLAFFLFAAGAAFKPDRVIFVHKNKCENGACISYENLVEIEQCLQDMDYYSQKIQSGDTEYDWAEKIQQNIKRSNIALTNHLKE